MAFGNYELLGEIARGGQGVVYRARQKTPNRVVALKMISLGPWANDSQLRRFKTEAEAAASLNHSQIVPIYDVGQVGIQHYFTMRLINGVSLRQVLAEGPLEPKRAASLVAQVAHAMEYAHGRGVLHRDVKPGNILLDEQDRPYVTDFGLAKVLEDESTLTHTMDLLGTPAYMSPEQAAGRAKELTAAADIYGLGAVLYEALTGVPPFSGSSTMETVRAVLEQEPEPPTSLNPLVDRDLETICLKCLEKEPEKRYATASELAEDLERWLGDEPILARPTTTWVRARRWVRRNPATAMAVPLVAVVLFAAGIILWLKRNPEVAVDPKIQPIAVLIRAGDGGSAALAKRYSQDLNHFLSKVSGVRVLDRTRVLKWEASNEPRAKIQQALGVPALILGTLRETNEFELEVEMASGSTSSWHRVFSNSTGEWSAIRSQIAREAMLAINARLSDEDRALLRRPLTTNHLAQSAYFRGLRQVEGFDVPALENAVASFQEAIELDGSFPEAYAGLSFAYNNLAYNFQHPKPLLVKAREALDRAGKIDSSLPQVRIMDGVLKYFYEWDWDGARRALEDAVRLDVSAVEANSCYLHLLDVFGRPEAALEKVRQVVELYPQSLAIRNELSCASYYAGQFDEAINYAREMIKDDPENAFNYFALARALGQKGRYEEALEVLKVGRSKPPEDHFSLESEKACIEALQERARKRAKRWKVRKGAPPSWSRTCWRPCTQRCMTAMRCFRS